MASISIWQLVIIAIIVVLLFGTKKLRGLGSDLGESIKGFKNALSSGKNEVLTESLPESLDIDLSSINHTNGKLRDETKEEYKNKQ
ncbi:twin-arginine translocase TatA/TatE family subunit [Vibrio cholerae]|uniref:twin-arginine translocase TatA/TatE family subunit n=1 Tax=Vibrio cholerae TaxID=666 RepID=UPI0007440AAD|nr:twin-arginine translocase TatA/TatE family subunit [Vibrio cholerae]ELH5151579.1 twin-arginine translocase TatA/TatE family subunit [Vibrio cholerae]KUO23377.1 hypothetical protein AVO51_17515 [Vibrio cholerae]HDI3294246.1 twin-arginine translocase TatA/TatE family subunit [Vibrio cholerae]HDZ3696035.1 twin-arginine translocase TatA/TatE family subunit [Vibrio cholerae]